MTLDRKMRDNRRFRSGSSVYTCRSCGKRTRETGNSESYSLLCLYCYDEAGQENTHSDEGHSGEFSKCTICLKALGRK